MNPETIDLWLLGILGLCLIVLFSYIISSHWWTIMEWIDRCNDRKKQKSRRKYAIRRR